MRMSAAAALAIGLTLSGTSAISAQTSDPTPFHQGQWAANFTIGSGFVGAGVLHFTSPTRALLVDLAGSYSHDDNSGGAAGASFFSPNAGNVSVRIGARAYRNLATHLWRWTTIGVFGSYNDQTNIYAAPDTTTFQSFGGGLFANLGATWMVTPHLGLGAQWEARLQYQHIKNEVTGSPITTDNVLSLTLDHVALTGQIFF